MKHVEDLQARLMYGEDDCPVGVSKLVQVREQLKGRGSIKTCMPKISFIVNVYGYTCTL